MVLQRAESSPEVWQAVLGCVTQLTTYNGITVRAFVEGMPQKVVAALLHCCVQHAWPQQVYGQLIRLAVNLLYVQPAQQVTSDDEADEEDTASQGEQCMQPDQQSAGKPQVSGLGCLCRTAVVCV